MSARHDALGMTPEQFHREQYLAALSDMLSGGKLVDTKDGADLPPERALMRVLGAQLKAITLAKFNGDYGQEHADWCMGSTSLSDDEMLDALSGIVATLRAAPVLMDYLRCHDEFREAGERVGDLEVRREEAVRLAGEVAIERGEGPANDDEGGAA